MANKEKKSVPTDWGRLFHTAQNVLLPIIVAVLVNYSLVPFAFVLILLGKWRVFAVQPRHWVANIRTNTPDLIVALSFLTFMIRSTTLFGLILAATLYGSWLLFLKPGSTTRLISAQAMVSQVLGLTALYWFADDISETVLVLAAWIISVASARHFLSAFEEPLANVIGVVWALFVVQMAWLLNRWLIVYTIYRNIVIPQIVLVVGTVGFVLASLYYLYKNDSLKPTITRRYMMYAVGILFLIFSFSDWNAEL